MVEQNRTTVTSTQEICEFVNRDQWVMPRPEALKVDDKAPLWALEAYKRALLRSVE